MDLTIRDFPKLAEVLAAILDTQAPGPETVVKVNPPARPDGEPYVCIYFRGFDRISLGFTLSFFTSTNGPEHVLYTRLVEAREMVLSLPDWPKE